MQRQHEEHGEAAGQLCSQVASLAHLAQSTPDSELDLDDAPGILLEDGLIDEIAYRDVFLVL